MILIRLSKIATVALLGLWALAAAWGNVVDYGTNWAFVRNVMAMTAVAGDPDVAWRAVTSPVAQRTAYAMIILAEFATAAALLTGAVVLAGRLRDTRARFQRAKAWVALGATAALANWMFGFMVVGGEWFQMWRSPDFNGQEAAFRFYASILIGAIYVFQDSDGDLQQKL